MTHLSEGAEEWQRDVLKERALAPRDGHQIVCPSEHRHHRRPLLLQQVPLREEFLHEEPHEIDVEVCFVHQVAEILHSTRAKGRRCQC